MAPCFDPYRVIIRTVGVEICSHSYKINKVDVFDVNLFVIKIF